MAFSSTVASAKSAVVITPNDTTDIPVTRSLYVGVAGNIAVIMSDGTSVTFSNVAVGILPIQVSRVLNTGTTATTMLALY